MTLKQKFSIVFVATIRHSDKIMKQAKYVILEIQKS
jgi:hypothetical protein